MALVQLQVRSDTASAWTAANPVLLAGEPGFETDTGKLKIGDGVRNWATLPYTSGVSLASVAPPATGAAAVGTSGLAARADHSHALPAAVSCTTLTVSGETNVGGTLNVTGELRGAPHKHSTNDITGLTALVVSTINSTLKAGSNVALSFDSVTNSLTVSSTAAQTGGGTAGVTSINGQTGAVTLAVLSASDVVSQITTAIQTIDGITETYDAKAGTITLGLSTVSGGTYGGTPTTSPLAFLAVPQSATASAGSASFSATATGGTASIAYQWEVSTDSGESWANVSGATSSSLSLTSLTAAEHGRQYRVRAASGTESISSPAATLTTVSLAITSQPADAAVTVWQSVSLSVTATAAGAITYQWQVSTNSGFSWSVASGTATAATYTFTPNVPITGTLYRAAVTSDGATVYSRAALVTATDPPLTISLNPVDTVAASCAASLSFDFAYAGSGSVTMQWQRRANATSAWVNVSGATGKILTLTGLIATDSGAQYRAGATVGTRTVYTTVATITVPALAIDEQPESVTAFAGEAMFSISYTGACGTAEVRWEVRQPTGATWAIVPGQTSNVLALTGLTRANSGQVYRAVVRVGTQVATSNEATLTVENVSGFAAMPQDATVASGEEVTFSYTWSNTADNTKAWWEVSRDNGVTWTNRLCSEFAACNAETLVFRPMPSDSGSQYRVVVKVLSSGFVYRSEPARLTVSGTVSVQPLGISLQPMAIAGDGAGGLVLTVTADTTVPQRSALCYVSTNSGASFSPASLPVTGMYRDVACGGSTWLAICPITGTIAYSTNRGRAWQSATVDVPFGALPDANNNVAKAYIDHLPGAPIPFVAATRMGVYTSPNGIDWTRRTSLASTTNPTEFGAETPVTYGGGKYLVVGRSGTWTSTGGVTWSLSAPKGTALVGSVNPSTGAVTPSSAAVNDSAISFAGGWFVGTGAGWLVTRSQYTTGTAAFSLSHNGLSYSVVSHPVQPSGAVQNGQPLQVGDGVFRDVWVGNLPRTIGVAALYPAEDADTWVLPTTVAPLYPSRTNRKGKGVAYVSPNRVAVAGLTAPDVGTGAQQTAVAILDARTPFSGTVPNASAPSAPQSFVATPLNGSIAVAWAEPLASGGLPITSYVLERKLTSGTSWTAASLATPLATSATISGLSNGVSYDVRVAAVTSAGTGVYATASATPALTAPLAPTGLTATPTGPASGSVTNTRYSLSWTAPSFNGGATITEYVVQMSTPGALSFPSGWVTLPYGSYTVTQSGTTATVTPFIRSASRLRASFRVAARNSVGTGPFSAETGLVSLN
jgi:titin